MTLTEIRNQVLSTFSIGQEVTMKITSERNVVTDTFKATVVQFYPGHVSTRHNGYIESFSFWEFAKYAHVINHSLSVKNTRRKRMKYA